MQGQKFDALSERVTRVEESYFLEAGKLAFMEALGAIGIHSQA
ncbi:hypothetical protein [Brevibacillus sp. SIMBA_040]